MGLIQGFDPFRVLKESLKKGAEFADIYIEDTLNCTIVCEGDKIEKLITGRQLGAGLRVISGFRTYYAYTNDLTERGLMALSQMVSAAAHGKALQRVISLERRDVSPGFPVRIDPLKESLEKKAGLVRAANRAARGFDRRVRQARVMYGDASRETAVVNSDGHWVEEKRTAALFVSFVVAGEGDVMQTGHESEGGAMGLELFDRTPPEDIALASARRAVMMLGARSAPPGRMTAVLSSEAGGTMIHEAIGHGLEADLAMEGMSVYSGKMGEPVASGLVTVIDDGTLPFRRGSSFFDDEGTPTQRTVLVEDGVLKGYMHDRLSAMKAGKAPTGNGRRESFRSRPIPRMTNTLIAPGTSDPASIVRSVSRGLFVKKMGGGQVDTVNGDFVFEVAEGYLIENGAIGEPVRGATLTGNGPEVLKAIDMVGSDLGFGIGTCGKDGQGAPVSDAQPTLRIPDIIVGGKAG